MPTCRHDETVGLAFNSQDTLVFSRDDGHRLDGVRMLDELTSSRLPVTQACERIDGPAQAWREAALAKAATRDNHDRLATDSRVFDRIKVVQPGAPAAATSATIRVAAWNLERCKHAAASAEVLAREKIDIALLTEMDFGMARSGNGDTAADIADALSMGLAWGTEFIELGLGNGREQAEHAGKTNSAGLHGNAIVSRYAIDRSAVLPLDEGGLWFTDADNGDQRRIGGRIAIAVRHRLQKPIWFVAVHYESRLGPQERARETEILLDHIESVCGNAPVLVGGDFNCKAVTDSGLSGSDVLSHPAEVEPMFKRMTEAGFDWSACNTPAVTTRLHPRDDPAIPVRKIDWFFARGLSCGHPAVVPATGADGNLSDHDMVAVEIAP